MKYKLYHGQSAYLSLKSAHKEIDEKKLNTNIKVLILNADTLSPQQILDTVSSQDLFSSERIIFLKRIYKNKNKDDCLTEVTTILKTSPSNDYIIFWEDQKIKANTKYYKFFKENDAIEESNKLDKRTFFTWLKEELEEQGLKIQNSATRLLAERTNYDPERCSNELKKLKLITKDNEITRADIENLISDTLEKDIWNLIDAINTKNTEESTKILERLISQNIDANYIISMLTRNLRLITLTKYLLEEKESTGNISKILKVPPFTVPSLMSSSKKYSNRKIKMLYTKMSNLDYQIKKGLIEPNLGITLLSSIL
ncbi:MAG TPA: DNA polymerase III subunit delta [Candidatus Pacearchaeota archaeon]|nr:DNA polymerase III subunit delta [Candidatus Pacearchaeota archaeon]